MFTLPTQPMTLSDAIKKTFELWWATLVSMLPLSIAAAIISSVPIFTKSYLGETHSALYIAALGIISIINIIPTTAIFAKLGHAAHNQPITLSQALGVGIIKFPAILGWLIISCACVLLAVGIVFLLSSHPIAVILSVLIFFLVITTLLIYVLCVVPLIIFENLPVIAAIQKSITITKNQWWYGGMLLTVIVIFGGIFNIAGALLLGPAGSVIGYCFTLPLQTSMIIIFYEHLKLRHERQS